MTTEAPPSTPPPFDAVPAGRWARVRLVLLALLAGAWVLPWRGDARGPDVTGPFGALALAAAWGLAATAVLARTRRQLAIGEAATSCALATLLAVLVVSRHPWLPGPDQRASWVPIFGPLAALSALDLVVRIARPSAGMEVTVIRAGAAVVAGLSLVVALQAVPAAVALFVGLGPVAVHWPKTARGAARGREVLALVAAAAMVVLSAMPTLLGGEATTSGEIATIGSYAYLLLAIALVAVATHAFFSRDASASAAP